MRRHVILSLIRNRKPAAPPPRNRPVRMAKSTRWVMTQSTRKLVGTIALLVMIAVYALLAMMVAIVLQTRSDSRIVEFAYYVIAGLAWTLPAGLLIKWMAKPDAPKR